MDLLEGFTRYQEGRNFAAKTIRRRRQALTQLRQHLGAVGWGDASADDVEEWLLRYPNARTRYHYWSDARVFYRWAVRRNLVATNPVDRVDPPRLPRAMPRPLQVRVLEAAIDLAEPDVRVMLLLGAHAGLRVSEIAQLQTADVFLHHQPPTLVVRRGKGGKDRVVPLSQRLQVELAAVPPGWVFPSSRTGGHLTVEWVRTRIERALEAVGCQATPHQLRHTFGTEVAQRTDGNLTVVADLMGHSQVSTSQGYVGWAPTATAQRAISHLYETPPKGP